MAKKYSYSGDAEKLRKWLNEHSNDGQINGKPIIEDTYTEVKGYVHERDYNDALRLAAPWAGKKAFIADHGIVAIASRSVNVLTKVEMQSLPTYIENQEESRLFRGRVTQGTLNILKQEIGSFGISLNTSQQATVVLRYFISDATIQRVYRRWLHSWLAETGMKVDEIEDVLYSFYRVDGAKKRLQAAEENNPDAQADKMH